VDLRMRCSSCSVARLTAWVPVALRPPTQIGLPLSTSGACRQGQPPPAGSRCISPVRLTRARSTGSSGLTGQSACSLLTPVGDLGCRLRYAAALVDRAAEPERVAALVFGKRRRSPPTVTHGSVGAGVSFPSNRGDSFNEGWECLVTGKCWLAPASLVSSELTVTFPEPQP
jgi:hypothetical protein